MSVAARLRPPEDAPLRRAFAAGQRAYPHLPLPYGRFSGRRDVLISAAHAEDYYLACACNAGVPGAWEQLQTRVAGPLRAFLRKRGASEADAHQILDEAWGSLAEPPPRGGAMTRIGTYDGRGSLRAWLATILWRRLADRWRDRSGDRELPSEESGPESSREDPAQRASQEESAALLGRALEEAWARLTDRELHAMVLKYRHQLPQTEIARALRVGAPRVTRILKSAANRLRTTIESKCRAHPAWRAPGGGWAGLYESLERMLARADASLEDTLTEERDDG